MKDLCQKWKVKLIFRGACRLPEPGLWSVWKSLAYGVIRNSLMAWPDWPWSHILRTTDLRHCYQGHSRSSEPTRIDLLPVTCYQWSRVAIRASLVPRFRDKRRFLTKFANLFSTRMHFTPRTRFLLSFVAHLGSKNSDEALTGLSKRFDDRPVCNHLDTLPQHVGRTDANDKNNIAFCMLSHTDAQ